MKNASSLLKTQVTLPEGLPLRKSTRSATPVVLARLPVVGREIGLGSDTSTWETDAGGGDVERRVPHQPINAGEEAWGIPRVDTVHDT